MICSIQQPNYIPWLGLFDKLANVDVHIFYDNAQYISNTIINRNKIRSKDGWIYLTVPVSLKFPARITEVKIVDQHWRKTHWKSIEANYSRAPYFKDYKDVIKQIYDKEWTSLAELNMTIIETISRLLGIKCRFVRASEILPDMKIKSTEALIELCQAVKADCYFSGADGIKYMNLDLFKKNSIGVKFQKYVHPTYKQVFPEFEQGMCIIDLLCNEGPQSLKILKTTQLESNKG